MAEPLILGGGTQISDARAKEICDIIEREAVAKNTVTISEFMKYFPLFSSTEIKNLSPDEHRTLTADYMSRFNQYENVTITTDPVEGEEPEVLMKFGKTFMRVGTLNDALQSEAGRVVDAFATACANDHPLRTDVERTGGTLINSIVDLQTNDKIAEETLELLGIGTELSKLIREKQYEESVGDGTSSDEQPDTPNGRGLSNSLF